MKNQQNNRNRNAVLRERLLHMVINGGWNHWGGHLQTNDLSCYQVILWMLQVALRPSLHSFWIRWFLKYLTSWNVSELNFYVKADQPEGIHWSKKIVLLRQFFISLLLRKTISLDQNLDEHSEEHIVPLHFLHQMWLSFDNSDW